VGWIGRGNGKEYGRVGKKGKRGQGAGGNGMARAPSVTDCVPPLWRRASDGPHKYILAIITDRLLLLSILI
jgi:hypothetical protein